MSEITIRVPLIKPDLPPFSEIVDGFRHAIETGQLTNFGPNLRAFEKEAGEYLGAVAVAVSSGTLGLLLTLEATGLARGAVVAMPSFTFVATAQAVALAGGVPVFVDVGEDGNLDTGDLEMLLSERCDVAAVVGVHLYGLPCDTEGVAAVVGSYSQRESKAVPVIYDAAHAFGSARNGRRVGSAGAAEVFSLSVTKALVSVEGGIVATTDEELAQKIRRMRNYGIQDNYNATEYGLNGKMSELHAIVGRRNLQRLDEVLVRRRQLAQRYRSLIEAETDCRNIELPSNVVHSFKDFSILLPLESADHRGKLRDYMGRKGIETRCYFDPPVHMQTRFAEFHDRPLPGTEAFARKVLNLPFYTTMTENEMDHVVTTLGDGLERYT